VGRRLAPCRGRHVHRRVGTESSPRRQVSGKEQAKGRDDEHLLHGPPPFTWRLKVPWLFGRPGVTDVTEPLSQRRAKPSKCRCSARVSPEGCHEEWEGWLCCLLARLSSLSHPSASVPREAVPCPGSALTGAFLLTSGVAVGRCFLQFGNLTRRYHFVLRRRRISADGTPGNG
jgi:hypothetical protein